MNPEKAGPIAGATAMTMVMKPMVRPRRAGGTKVITVVMSSGSMTAVPLAWMTRAATSIGKTWAAAASTVPAMNRPIAPMKTVRVVKRWRMSPVMGMTTAMVSMKPVVSHCTVAAVRSNRSMRGGRATPITVSLRIMTKAATRSTPSTSLICFDMPGSAVGASSAAAASGVSAGRWSTVMGEFPSVVFLPGADGAAPVSAGVPG